MLIFHTKYVQLIYVLFLTVILSGCSSIKKKETMLTSTEVELYQAANQLLNNKHYSESIAKLRTIESLYPLGLFSEQIQLDLMYAYFMNTEPELLKITADRFLHLHPKHQYADYVYYMKGLVFNTASIHWIENYLSLDKTKRNAEHAKQSLNAFRELLSRYPNSKYVQDAYQRIVALTNHLAAYEIHVANHYMQRKAYVATVNRGKYVVEHFPKTPAMELALGLMIEGYQHLGLVDLANTALQVLKLHFPNSNFLNKNGDFIGYQSFRNVDQSIHHHFRLFCNISIEK